MTTETKENESKDNEKMFFEFLANQLGLKEREDWYSVKRKDVIKHGGESLLKTMYNGSLGKALQSVYPDHKWLLWKFDEEVPKKSWSNPQLQKDFMEYLGKELKIEKMEDWYTVTQKQFNKKRGARLLKKHRSSPSEIIMSAFPEHKWDLFRFYGLRQPSDSIEYQKEFIKELVKQLNITKMDDWYSITKEQIYKKGGGRLMMKYDNSPSKLIMSMFPEHKWNLFQFHQVPRRMWEDVRLQREFYDKASRKVEHHKDGRLVRSDRETDL
eukprot:TRINITY_DN1979_c0_g1_i3.p1 TRINITY_DN1979_c0_g1~~TRINITY_DN1979_c0_g1_i3.p1  ORF type:complete len:269 (+),score=45.57 TRINITY_DN1979_c0_g1_i3:142-948(+)